MMLPEEILLLVLREFRPQREKRSRSEQEDRGKTAADQPEGTHGR